MMEKIELLKSILHDIESMDIDYSKDDNQYHYKLATDNLKDLIKAGVKP